MLEYINGVTLDTPDLAHPDYIPRIGRAIRDLHTLAPPMRNSIVIWKFLEDYLGLLAKYSLDSPNGLLDHLPTMRRIQSALDARRLPPVPSNNDLLAKNVMDDGRVRLIDYDFSGMNDPMFDVGDVAMEGDYGPDQIELADGVEVNWLVPIPHYLSITAGAAGMYCGSCARDNALAVSGLLSEVIGGPSVKPCTSRLVTMTAVGR